MTEAQQTIPVDGITRFTLECRGFDVLVRWTDSPNEVRVTGGEIDVETSEDELFGTVVRSKRRAQQDFDAEVLISGFESPAQAVEEILFRTGILGGKSRGQKGPPMTIEVPMAFKTTNLELDKGSLTLHEPQGVVVCKLKRGDVTALGGQADLDISAGSGEVQINRLEGSLRVSGGSGDISVSDVGAVTNIKAGSGEITLDRVTGEAIKLAAGSGDIVVRGCSSRAYSSDCGSGDVRIDGGSLDRINVRTGSGDVDCTAVFDAYPQSFTTGSGTISLGVPRTVSARIEAFTSGGGIDTDLPLVSVGQRGPKSRRSRRQVGSVGSGEPRAEVSLRTSSGDIRIHWLSHASTQVIPMPPPVPDAPKPPEPPSPPTPPVAPAPPVTSKVREETDVTSTTSADEHDEWQQILESLANGEISVEEADALLESIELRQANARG